MTKNLKEQSKSVDRSGASALLSRQINDALLVPWAGDLTILRVVAFTDDRRAVVKTRGDKIKVEDQPGAWAKVGYFIPRVRPWFDLFGFTSGGWTFCPSG